MGCETLALWGGVECTLNRVGDRFHQQLARSGHLNRIEDIDAFAGIGLSGLRVPVIWELAETSPGSIDLARFDAMLLRVKQHGMRAIAGLVHHGSGPRWTHLLDAEFEHGLARYAAAVAARYPWLCDYTPINEPLTTARFSALYGFWYPHRRDHASFVRALLNQTRATVRAMSAIREVQPHARLVQTEDIAQVASSDTLRYEADYQNQRRWLSLDLLCGHVDRTHPLRDYLQRNGAREDELQWLCDNPCPPDIIGANYYFTSDRYLDERTERYPAWSYAHNGRHSHADVHASACASGLVGHRAVIEAVWDRYHIPIALTEVHAGSTREEQLRWLNEAWEAAVDARDSGVKIEAVTAWALLGSFDWNKLVVEDRGFYEPGVFDLRSPRPRPTALANMIRDMAAGVRHEHPVLECSGWWRRKRDEQGKLLPSAQGSSTKARPILITGAAGTLGQAFARACDERGLAYQLVERRKLDIGSAADVDRALGAIRPWAVVNAAGFVRVDEAELQAALCMRANTLGPAILAAACRRHASRLLTFSTDLVFDGTQRAPYLESAAVAPLSVYGRSKVDAEKCVLGELPQALVVRTSAFFGPHDDANFVSMVIRELRMGRRFRASDDSVVSPTYVPHLVDACLDLLIDGDTGIRHLANLGAVSWAELAAQVAVAAGLPGELVVACSLHELGLLARRPPYSVLGSERGLLMPTLEEGLQQYFHRRELQQSA